MSLAVACVFLCAGHSHAQLYKWTDENGKTHYTDSIPPSANDRARKELRADGTVKYETTRALTLAEKQAAEKMAAEEAKNRAIQDERDRKDRALLNTYPNLQDFDRVRDRALAIMDMDIQSLVDREIMLGKVMSTDGAFVPPTVTASTTPTAKPTAPAPSKDAAKSTTSRVIEAKAELPRLKETIARKQKDRADMARLYASERVRLSGLIDAEKAKLASSAAAASANTSVPVKK